MIRQHHTNGKTKNRAEYIDHGEHEFWDVVFPFLKSSVDQTKKKEECYKRKYILIMNVTYLI
jgi:hypothetical protein